MRQIDLSQFANYDNAPPLAEPPPDPDPNAAIVDGTLAQAFNNDFIARQQALLHEGPDAFYAKRGGDALAATPAVLDQLQTMRDQLVGSTANARQRQILSQALDNHLTVSRADIARHTLQQQRVWQSNIAQDRLNLLHKQAGFAYDDPESVANYANAGRSAALHQASLAGFDADSEEADARASNAASGIWRGAIQTALDGMHTAPAVALWEKAAAVLSPQDSAALAPQIEAAKEHQTGQDYLATLRVPDTRDLNAIGEAHQAATARNEADWPHNDRQRATNQHFIDIAFNRKKRDALNAKADVDRQLSDLVYRPGATGPLPLHLLVQLDDDTRRHVYRQLAQNAFDPLENVKDSYAKRSGASPGVEPQARSSEDRLTPDQVQRPQVVDRDAGQAEKDRAITDEIVRRAAVDAQNGTVKDSVTDPKVRDEIVRGLMSEDPQERLKWARAPLYQYKSSLSNTDFARLAGVQRQLSPYDGMPREGLGHPIGTLEDNAEAAAALSVGKFLRPFINLGRAGLERLGRQTDENNEVAPPSEAPGTTPSGTAAKIGKDGLTAAQRMAKNRADGLRFEQETGEELGAGQDEVFEQVTMRTKSGIKVRVDFATRNRETGEIRLFEAKASEKARLTRNQKAGYEEIEKSGGTVVGKGKPGFPGGTKIPPTKVEIIRPARKEP